MVSSGLKSIRDISGSWVMDKNLSSNLDSVLKLQGISWITRKAVAAAKTTLKITMGSDTDGFTSMRLEQASGGLKGEPENRQLTWAEFEHNDTLFGPVIIRSHYIAGTRYLDKGFRPIVELQTTAAGSDVRAFLTELIGTDLEAESEHMTVEKVFIHDFVRNAKSGWKAEQIWALEVIGEEEFLTRRVVVVRNTSTELAQFFYRRE